MIHTLAAFEPQCSRAKGIFLSARPCLLPCVEGIRQPTRTGMYVFCACCEDHFCVLTTGFPRGTLPFICSNLTKARAFANHSALEWLPCMHMQLSLCSGYVYFCLPEARLRHDFPQISRIRVSERVLLFTAILAMCDSVNCVVMRDALCMKGLRPFFIEDNIKLTNRMFGQTIWEQK
jgi:hypothetical protein